MNAGDMIRQIIIGLAVGFLVAVLVALLKVSYERREPIPWRAMWRSLTKRKSR